MHAQLTNVLLILRLGVLAVTASSVRAAAGAARVGAGWSTCTRVLDQVRGYRARGTAWVETQ